MKKIAITFLFMFYLLAMYAENNVPNWNVNPSDYSSTATMIAKLSINNVYNSENNLIAAFVNDECRGVANAETVINQIGYYLTIYGNTDNEVVTFKVFYEEAQEVLDITETISFSSNAVYGNVLSPLDLNAFYNFDNAPNISNIQNQVVDFGEEFSEINLNEFLTELDNDPIIWSYSGNNELILNLENGIVSITKPEADWTGAEIITFTVTDDTNEALNDSEVVTFKVRQEDHAPIINNIPDQTKAIGMSFDSIDLDNYLTELDGDQVSWKYEFLPSQDTTQQPSWDINPSDYQMSMTMFIEVSSKGELIEGSNHTLAAFSGNECRGIATASNILDKWIFSLMIYSNSNNETITFKLYDENFQQTLPALQNLAFVSNSAHGSPNNPFQMDTGNLYVSINSNNIASVESIDPNWYGVENLRFICTDEGTSVNHSDSEDIILEIVNDNAPIVSGIPDQTIEQGQVFSEIHLNSFLTELDGDSVAWSYSGNSNLSVNLAGNEVATISPIDSSWHGTEEITFLVKDDGTVFEASNSETVSFTIRPLDHEPILSEIPNQNIGSGGSFQNIDLNNYLTELDGDEIIWDYEFLESEVNDPEPNWVVNSSDYELSSNVIAEVYSKGNLALGSSHKLAAFVGGECRGVASAVFQMNKWIYFLTINANTNGEELRFKFYDDSYSQVLESNASIIFSSNDIIGTVASPLQVDAANILINIENSIAEVSLLNNQWTGSEVVEFTARDHNTSNNYSDNEIVTFSINPTDNTPILSDLPNQEIEFGESFDDLNLSSYLTELDGDNVIWSYSGNDNIAINISSGIATFESLNEEWSGSEIIVFTVTDDTPNRFSSEKSLTLTINSFDNEPTLSAIPDQIIGTGTSFATIPLTEYLTELDGDEIEWDFEFSESSTPEEEPSWNVNPADFELSMNVVAEVKSKGKFINNSSHKLAAFIEGECRGIAEAEYYEDFEKWIFIITIYSNSNNENISFRFFDTNYEQNLPVVETLQFQHNTVAGQILSPFMLNSFYLNVNLSAEGNADVEMIDANWTGEESIIFSVKDKNTNNLYSDSVEVKFRKIEAIPPESFPQSITINEDVAGSIILEGESNTETLDFLITDQPNNGELSGVIPNLIYTPNANFYGEDQFSYVVNDGIINSDVSIISVSVSPQNDLPINIEQPQISGDLLVKSELTVSQGIWNDPDVIKNQNYVFEPSFTYKWYVSDDNIDFIEVENFSSSNFLIPDDYFAKFVKCKISCIDNGFGNTSTMTASTFSNSVQILNSSPKLIYNNATYSTSSNFNLDLLEDNHFQTSLRILDDNSNESFIWSSLNVTNGNVVITQPRFSRSTSDIKDIKYTPNENFVGEGSFTIQVRDSQNATNSITFTFNILPINDAPMVQNEIVDFSFNEDTIHNTINLNEVFTDVDLIYGDHLAFSHSGNENVNVGIAESGFVTLTPISNWNGVETITFTATDDSLLFVSDEVVVTIDNVNDAPIVYNEIDDFSFEEDTIHNTINLNEVFTDVDLIYGDNLYFSYYGNININVDISDSGIVTLIPETNWYGDELVRFKATDNQGLTVDEEILVTINPVNDFPIADAGSFYQTISDSTGYGTLFISGSNSFDIEGNISSFLWEQDHEIISQSESFTYSWREGTDIVIYLTITDNEGVTAQDSARIYIGEYENNSPVAIDDYFDVAEEDILLGSVLDNDYDDNYPNDLSSVLVQNVENGSLDFNADGSFTYQPFENYNGMDSFTYQISDGDLTALATARINVNYVNDAPIVLTTLQDFSFDEDSIHNSINLNEVFTDVDIIYGDGLAFSYSGNNNINIEISETGIITFSPRSDWNGTENITLIATDNSQESIAFNVHITIINVNDTPTIDLPNSFYFTEDMASTLDLTGFINDIDPSDNLTLSVQDSEHIFVEISGFTATFTNALNWNGTEEITFTINDNVSRAIASDTIPVSVIFANDAPMVQNEIVDFSFDEDTINTSLNLHEIFTDLDIIYGDELSFSYNDNSHIEVDIDEVGVVTLSPLPNWYGLDFITFTATDLAGEEVSESVLITINNISEDPTINLPDSINFNEDRSLMINFGFYIEDLDSSDLTLTCQNSEHIFPDINDLTVSFSASLDWHGVEHLIFTVSDANQRAIATDSVFVNVVSIEDSPEVVNPILDFSFNEDTVYNEINLNEIFSDGDLLYGDSLSFYYSGNENISVEISDGGQVSLIPQENWFGTEFISFEARDNSLNSVTDEVMVVVGSVNDSPIVDLPSEHSLSEDSVLIIDYSTFISDVDSESLTLTSEVNEHVFVSINDLQVTYSLLENWSGSEEIIFSLYDNETRATAIDTVLINVSQINDSPFVQNEINYLYSFEDLPNNDLELSYLFSDPDLIYGDNLNYSYSGNVNLSVEVSESGLVTLTPNNDWNGEEVISFTATDESLMSITHDIIIVIASVNDSPTIVSEINPIQVLEDFTESYQFDLNDYFADVDGDELIYTIETDNSIVAYELDANILTITSIENVFGVASISVSADDGYRNIMRNRDSISLEFSLEVLNVNDSPYIQDFVPNETELEIAVGDSLEFSIVAIDIDSEMSFEWYLNNELQSEVQNNYLFIPTNEGAYEIEVKTSDGEFEVSQLWSINCSVNNDVNIVHKTELVKNYPNPFNPRTTIVYNLNKESEVSLQIFNIRGQNIKTLYRGIDVSGEHSIIWNGKNNKEQYVSSGTYFVVLKTASKKDVMKILLVK